MIDGQHFASIAKQQEARMPAKGQSQASHNIIVNTESWYGETEHLYKMTADLPTKATWALEYEI